MELGSLARERGPAELVDASGKSIRLEPSSDLRFRFADGRRTDWIPARKLATDGERIRLPGGWVHLRSLSRVEIRSDDHVANLAVTVGAVAVAAALVALAMTEGKSDVRSSSRGAKKEVGSVDDTAPRRVPGYALGPRGPAFVYEQPEYLRVRGSGLVRRPRSSGARPLFGAGARRRFTLAPLLSARSGLATAGRDSLSWDLALGLRMLNMFEMQVGLRRSVHPFPEQAYGPWLVTFGVGGNFRLAGPLGFPIGLDFAGGEGGLRHFRIPYGLRFRIARRLDVVVEPATPELAIRPELYGWGTHHGLRLSFAF